MRPWHALTRQQKLRRATLVPIGIGLFCVWAVNEKKMFARRTETMESRNRMFQTPVKEKEEDKSTQIKSESEMTE